MIIDILTADQLDALSANTTLLGGSPNKPKVLATADNTIIKFFWPRNWPHKRRRIFSGKAHAIRFVENAEYLAQKSIISPKIKNIAYCAERNVHIVEYQQLAGTAVKTLYEKGVTGLLPKLSRYLYKLHQKGILFRGIHLGNVLHLEDGQFALIDFVGLKTQSKPLNLWQRARNFRHLLLDRNDKKLFLDYSHQRFIDDYFKIAHYKPYQEKTLQWLIARGLKQ